MSRVVSFLTFLSLLLVAAVAAVWVRSHLAQDHVIWERVRERENHRVAERYVVHTYRGGVEVAASVYGKSRRDEAAPLTPRPAAWTSAPPRPSFHFPRRSMTLANRVGFLLDSDRVVHNSLAGTFAGGWLIAIPFWAPAFCASLLPGFWLAGRHKRRRWAREGRCGACGYDLRGTPDHCPECGAATDPGPGQADSPIRVESHARNNAPA